MRVLVTEGQSNISVGSGAQVNLLQDNTAFPITPGANTNGINIDACNVYALNVYVTGADITLRIYKSSGPNVGLRAAYSATVSAGSAFTYEFAGNSMFSIAVTGQTASGTATVSADLRGKVYP